MSTSRLLVLTLLLLGLGAAVAGACPVCLDASNPTVIEEYRRSTMFLSLLPFGIVGSIAGAGAYLARHPPARDAGDDTLNVR